MQEILTGIRKSTEILETENIDFTKIGSVDDSFSHFKLNFRKLINVHCKITYREGTKNIYIVRVFDTRENPAKNL